MKKPLLFISAIFIISIAWAKNDHQSDNLKKIQQNIVELNNQILQNKSEIEGIKSLVQISNGTISSQLSSSQVTLNVLSYIFAVIGIILAVVVPIATYYITRLAGQVNNNIIEANRILANINELRANVISIQEDVNNTQEIIKNNLSGLYQSLQNEEVKSIFNRLKDQPLDIQHFFSKLATIGLVENYFEELKSIYFKIVNIDTLSASSAMMLLSQYYPTQVFNDDKLIEEIKRYYIIDALYQAEIQFYFKSLCKFIATKDIKDYMQLFENPLLGIELINDSADIKATEMLKTWNECLHSNQKKIIIDFINASSLTKFKKVLPNWALVLTT